MISKILMISEYLKRIVESRVWNVSITALIALNTIVLGMETYPQVMDAYGEVLLALDQQILYLFVAEMTIRLMAHGYHLFKNPWSVFDLFVVGVALIPAQEAFSALRAARALRALRLISMFPKLRGVLEGLVMAIPGIVAIGTVMAIIVFVFGLMASKLYGANYPEWFGNLHLSVFSLFQIMTLEGWPEIVRTVMQEKPYAWVFFVSYILIATFCVLNLFIAVIVEAMQRNQAAETLEDHEKIEAINKKLDLILKKVGAGHN